jgi:predicted MPP superfamily phosphohydrolase
MHMPRWVRRNVRRWKHATRVEPTWLEINRLAISIPDAPTGWSVRIAQLSDIHLQRSLPLRYLEECMSRCNALQPDIITLTGDYIHAGERYVDRVAEVLSRLRAPLGVFAVLGNHDYAVRNALAIRRSLPLAERISRALSHHGIRVLRNDRHTLEHAGHAVQIAGVGDLWSRDCNLSAALRGLNPGLPSVLLAHHPRTVELLRVERCDLVLSGHTHGGQVHLPRVGSVLLGRKMKRYAAGLYERDGRKLYVHKGVGYGVKFRLNRRPEIAVFTLHGPPVGTLPNLDPTAR